MNPPQIEAYSDAAKRVRDAINMHLAVNEEGTIGRWIAVRLSDGGSDGNLYDTRKDAIKHQLHETTCAYIKIPLGGMPIAEAERYMAFNRAVYDGGLRFCDPANEAEPIIPLTLEDYHKVVPKTKMDRETVLEILRTNPEFKDVSPALKNALKERLLRETE